MARKSKSTEKWDCFFKKARTDQKLTYEEAAEISGISSRLF